MIAETLPKLIRSVSTNKGRELREDNMEVRFAFRMEKPSA